MSPSDEVIAGICSTVHDPNHIHEIVGDLVHDSKTSWEPDEFAELTRFDPIIELIYHSAFIRSAARRGYVFYIGSDKRVYQHTATRHGRIVEPSQIDLEDGDDTFFAPEWYDDLKKFVEDGASVLLIGPPGSGKTLACERLFEDRDQTLQVVSCTPSMTADDLEGRVELRNEGGATVTQFEPAILATASRFGHAVLLDEADAIPASASFGLFRLLDGRDMRIQRMGSDGVVPRHDQFRVVGTQNTEGRGDDRGLHHGRSYQDEAWLDRWDNVIRVDYFPKEVEAQIVAKRSGLPVSDAARIVDGADLLRRALQQDKIMLCCTMRRTIAVAKNIARGYSEFSSWNYAVINRATREDRGDIVDILGRVYGGSWDK